eukprot:3830818-Amphidinium_carterae.1
MSVLFNDVCILEAVWTAYGLTLAEIDWLQSGLEADGHVIICMLQLCQCHRIAGCVHEDTVPPENA